MKPYDLHLHAASQYVLATPSVVDDLCESDVISHCRDHMLVVHRSTPCGME